MTDRLSAEEYSPAASPHATVMREQSCPTTPVLPQSMHPHSDPGVHVQGGRRRSRECRVLGHSRRSGRRRDRDHRRLRNLLHEVAARPPEPQSTHRGQHRHRRRERARRKRPARPFATPSTSGFQIKAPKRRQAPSSRRCTVQRRLTPNRRPSEMTEHTISNPPNGLE